MTNKGSKYLTHQLESLKSIQRETARQLNEERVKVADQNKIIKKMEEDLLLLCNDSLLRSFLHLITLRADLKKRMAKEEAKS